MNLQTLVEEYVNLEKQAEDILDKRRGYWPDTCPESLTIASNQKASAINMQFNAIIAKISRGGDDSVDQAFYLIDTYSESGRSQLLLALKELGL